MKATRHAMILQLIGAMEIETQEMLAEQLMQRGMRVTQATISRDIKELRLVKVLNDKGDYHYAAAERAERPIPDRMIRLFAESVISIVEAENLIVIKTLAASAQLAAEAIDGLGWSEIAGTLAGENTIFVAVKSKELVAPVVARLRGLMEIDER